MIVRVSLSGRLVSLRFISLVGVVRTFGMRWWLCGGP